MNDRFNTTSTHAHWVTACQQLRAAYQRWCEAPLDVSSDGYAAVLAMFDQEAAAASAYGRAVKSHSFATDRTS
jgi:hypothetical protein